jgi:iron complex outermembrane receptor protein
MNPYRFPSLKKILPGFFSLLAFATALNAQTSGGLKGRCTDRAGSPAKGATVRLLNTTHTTVTDGTGGFLLSSVAPGRYLLSVTSTLYEDHLTEVRISPSSVTELEEITLREASQSLSEVVVTAEKREETSFRTPVAVTSLGRRQVEAFRLWDLAQLTSIVPNLYTSEPGDGRNVTGIRGIATTSYDPAVATYVDGVNQFSLDTHIPQLTDVERVEVLRGPQGTLFGRNAMGGVIQVTTRKPTNRTTAFVESNIGNYGLHRHTAGFRTPIVRDRLHLSSSFMLNRRNGYHVNEFDGSDFDRLRQIYGNHNLVWNATSDVSVTLNVKHLAGSNEGAFPLAPDIQTALEKPYLLNQNAASTMHDRTFNASLSATWDHRAFRLTSSTAIQSNHRYYAPPIDGDFSPLDIVTIDNDFGRDLNLNRVWTQEWRIQNPSGKDVPWTWTAGAFLFQQHNPTRQATRFGAQAGLIGVTGAPFSITNDNLAEGSGMALFGQVTRQIGERWRITAGLRQDWETRNLTVRSEFEAPGVPPTVTRPDTSGRQSYSSPSPKLGIQYLIDERQSVHLTYARGFRTGGLTPVGSDPSAPPLSPFGPEHSDNLEAGWKLQSKDNRLRLGLYGFLGRVKDVQTPTLILPDALTVTRNTGDLRIKGMEVEMEAIPLTGLEVSLTGGVTDARYDRLLLSVDGEEKDLKGNRQIFTPGHTLLAAVQYSLPIGKTSQTRLQTRFEWGGTGRTHFDLSNRITQEAYTLINARMGIQGAHIGLHVWLRNATERLYIDYAYPFGAAHLGPPRTWGLTFSARY